MIHIKLQGLPKRTNNQRANWRAVWAERKKWKQRVLLACIGQTPYEPYKKAQVTIIRHSSREPDFDGLVSSGKALLDGLVEAGVIIDDKPSVIGQPQYRWQKARQKDGHVEIIVVPIHE